MYKAYGLEGHNGIDFGAVTGTPVYAADDGTVIEAKEESTGYGRHVHIEHSHGETIYGHLSAMLVRPGDVVKAKTCIGKSGGDPSDPFSGNSTGPHLHFEYRPKGENRLNGYGGAVNPEPLLQPWDRQPSMPVLFKVQVNSGIGLNGRSGPGKSYPLVKAFPDKTVLGVIDEENNWYRVDDDVPVWVSCDYVVQVGGQQPKPAEPKTVEERLAAIEQVLKDKGWL